MQQRFLFFIVFIVFSLHAQAEIGVLAGARAGLNISSLRKFEPITDYKKRVILGSDLSGVLRLDFNKYISLQTEIEFAQKGQGWKKNIDSAKYSGKLVMNYVQFPILVVGRFGTDKVKGVVQLGPYISYWTGGYTQNSVSIDKQSKNASTYKYIFTSNDKRVDAGLVVGAGTDIKVGKGWIELALRYNAGFVSSNKKSTLVPKMYHSNVSISVGYLYTIKSLD